MSLVNILSKAKKEWASMSSWKKPKMTYQEYEISKLDNYINEQRNIDTVVIVGLKNENASLQALVKKYTEMFTEVCSDKKTYGLRAEIGKLKKDIVDNAQKYVKRLAEVRTYHKKTEKELTKLRVLYTYASNNSNFVALEQLKLKLETTVEQTKVANRLYAKEVENRKKFTKKISEFLGKDLSLSQIQEAILNEEI